MSRAVAALALTVVAFGCGLTRAEEETLRDFFQASRARDSTMLAKVATVTFDPATDGTVRDFEVTGIGAPRVDIARVSKIVAVTALVRTPEGKTVPTRLVFDFQRALDEEPGSRRAGPWIITGARRSDH